MPSEQLDKFRFSRGQKLTLVRSKIGLLMRVERQICKVSQVCSPKIALKPAILNIAKGQLLDTLLSYQGFKVFLMLVMSVTAGLQYA